MEPSQFESLPAPPGVRIGTTVCGECGNPTASIEMLGGEPICPSDLDDYLAENGEKPWDWSYLKDPTPEDLAYLNNRRLTFGLAEVDDVWGPQDIVCAYVDGVQVAAAVRLGEIYAEQTGCEYHLVSRLADDLRTVLCRDMEQAVAWLNFLADLYEGKKKK